MVDRVLLKRVLVPVPLKTKCEEAILLPPVTEIVYSGNVPSGTLVKVGEESADDSASQMARVEWLRDIWRRKLDEDLLPSRAGVGRVLQAQVLVPAVLLAELSDLGQNCLSEGGTLAEEGNEISLSRGFLEKGIVGELLEARWSDTQGYTSLPKQCRVVSYFVNPFLR